MSNFVKPKPHAVLIPAPFQGHINALFKLGKLLHLRGFHITFVNTEYNHKRLLESRDPNSLDGFNDFNFETIPDGLTPMEGNGDVTQDIYPLVQSIMTNFLQPFDELLTRLHQSANDGVIPPITCLVSDCYMPFTVDRCYESYLTNGYLDNKVGGRIPGLHNFRLKDLPDFTRITDPNDLMIKFITEVAVRCHRASSIVINTSYELESDVMNALYSMFPSIYTIGPFASFLNQSPQNHLASLNSNLWKEDTKCLEWLESKEPRSVVYVNFGSITVMSREKLLEFAWGLANSKNPFLWIIRPDLVIGGSVVLSSDFFKEVSDRGLIASWCPQDKVLNHPSIGGFLTHCGWNSTTESICAGVPMLCWPFFGDQPTNCRFICYEWEIGLEIDTNVKRDDVEKLVNELMVGENGKTMKQKVLEFKKKAEENTRSGGFSYMNLDKVIKEVMLKQF
ncbi:putative 7-deoxyloganetin glucosyltransferase [Medicago truncatula]|uniref:Glycosyltransferase n=1 Tax=Medicago truncatula TaxID=3880 RepID=A0A396HTW7_MEDTR|nr:putative 7-deoxyloganetin glucosyltransferase [Medicago truncatula]